MYEDYYQLRTYISATLLLFFHLPFVLYFINRGKSYQRIIVIVTGLFYGSLLIHSVYKFTICALPAKYNCLQYLIFHSWLFVLFVFLILNYFNILNAFKWIMIFVYSLLLIHLLDMTLLYKEILKTGKVQSAITNQYIEPESGIPTFTKRVYLNDENKIVINSGIELDTKYMEENGISVSFYLFKYIQY